MLASSLPMPRLARIAVSNFFFVSGLCFATWASRIPDIQHHLGLNQAQLGTVLFASPVGSMLCLPLAGIMVTRFGSRLCILAGSVLYTLTLCLIGTVNHVWELAALLFMFGFAGNMMNISINAQAVGVEALYQRSIMASFHGLWSLAGFTAAAIGTLMVSQSISPVLHFIIVAVLIMAIVLLFIRNALKNDERSENEKSGFAWPDKSLLNLGLVAFCCMVCEGCMFDWSGIYFRDVVKAPHEYVTIGYTTFMATMASGRFIADRMVTRFGVKIVLQVSGCLISAGLLISVIYPNIYFSALGFLLTGFGVSSVVPLAYGLAGKNKKMGAGMAIASVSTVGFLGFLFGPPLIGYIAQALDLRWSFALMALIGFGTTIMAGRATVSASAS